MMEFNLSALMEPRGFIKLLQFIFVICAFSLACDFRGHIVLNVDCDTSTTTDVATDWSHLPFPTRPPTTEPAPTTPPPTTTKPTTPPSTTKPPITLPSKPTTPPPTTSGKLITTKISTSEEPISTTEILSTTPAPPLESARFSTTFKYTFNLEDFEITSRGCDGNDATLILSSDQSSNSIFFVFMGVFSMIFTMVVLAFYFFEKETYQLVEWVPVVDLVLHAILTLMWFGSSIAMACSLTALQRATELSEIIVRNPSICGGDDLCTLEDRVYWAKLDWAVICGFLSFLLYAGNCWCIFIKTKYYPAAEQRP